jgi:type IV conjugative transfer system coupling protein TraD
MSIFRNDTLGSWTRGGQAIVHNVRMTTQVFFQTMSACLVLWVMGIIWYCFETLTAYQRYVLVQLALAEFRKDATRGAADLVQIQTPGGYKYWTTAEALLNSGVARKTLEAGEAALLTGSLIGGIGAALALGSAWYYFTRTGRGLGSNQFLRGTRFGTVRSIRLLLRRYRKGSFTIAGVTMPHAFEPEHIVLCGAPGTGKTNIITTMLEGIRKNGKRAIVYDTAGSFVEKFYRPGKDILLNPLDQRTDHWSPWVDVPREYHYDQIAQSTIPDKAGDPFWAKAARGTLVGVLRKLATQQHTLVSILLDRLLRSGLKDLVAFAEGTEAAAFISMEGDRTSAGIQAELASVMRSFAYLDDTTNGFSIRRWVENETDDSWLFITVKADQLPSLRPLITVWIDIAIGAIMSMKPDSERRLYCIIDELPTLQRLPSLSDFLARARKYGGCGILGFQSYPQLEATYGIQEAAAITGYCSTWIALRANDTPTAKHVSENLGQVEQIEANEGMSYGVNDMRDGVNLSRMQVTRPLVMHTEVTNLPNLSGFLRFGRDLPVIRFADRFNPIANVAPAFVERTKPPIRLPLADEIIQAARSAAQEQAPQSGQPGCRSRTKAARESGSAPPPPNAPGSETSRPELPLGQMPEASPPDRKRETPASPSPSMLGARAGARTVPLLSHGRVNETPGEADPA